MRVVSTKSSLVVCRWPQCPPFVKLRAGSGVPPVPKDPGNTLKGWIPAFAGMTLGSTANSALNCIAAHQSKESKGTIMDLHLKGKVAIITGGSRGIGRATAEAFAQEGADIAICARDDSGLAQAVTDLEHHGTRVIGIPADVSSPGDTERFIDSAVDQLGGIDALVCNVGGREGDGLEDSTDEDWMKTFDLNLFHAVRASRASLPHFRKGSGGSITIISSISGWKPAPSRAQYGATKAAEMFLAGSFA